MTSVSAQSLLAGVGGLQAQGGAGLNPLHHRRRERRPTLAHVPLCVFRWPGRESPKGATGPFPGDGLVL